MKVKKLNQKSLDLIKKKGWFFVLEGSVRSAKTMTSLVKWYYFIISSSDNMFLMSGATMGSLSKNCIDGDYGLIAISGNKFEKKTDSEGNKYLSLNYNGKEKRVYYTGAEKSNNYTKIQGMSSGGWYADEITNHHKSFVEMAFSRSFAAENIFFIWTLNPENPSHWLYKEYIDKYNNEKKEGYYYYHFNLDDNMALSEERKDFIRSSYTGIFYRRYVLGERVRAEGSCYPSFDDQLNVIDKVPDNILFVQIGFDIGGNKSATSLTATGFYWNDKKMNIVVIDELYDQKNKDTETVLNNYVNFVKKIQAQYNCADCFIDSAEQLILKSARGRGLINVHNSLKRPVIDRIRFTDMMLSQGRMHILRHCTNTIEAIESAVFDSSTQDEKRLDNGTTNIDSLDSLEYSFENRMKEII